MYTRPCCVTRYQHETYLACKCNHDTPMIDLRWWVITYSCQRPHAHVRLRETELLRFADCAIDQDNAEICRIATNEVHLGQRLLGQCS